MPLNLNKLISLGKKAVKTAEQLQQSAKPKAQGGSEGEREATRDPGTIASGSAVVLYWQEAGGDTGWYCDRCEVDGKVVLEAGRVGEETANTPEALAVAKQLFREHFGRELVWEQPDPGEPRYVGRLSG